jgi:hypothetical protein
VSPVRYELGFYIPEDDILYSHRRENLKSYIIYQFDCITLVSPLNTITKILGLIVAELCKSLVCLESSFACIPRLKDSIMKRTEACIKVAHGYAAVNTCEQLRFSTWQHIHNISLLKSKWSPQHQWAFTGTSNLDVSH